MTAHWPNPFLCGVEVPYGISATLWGQCTLLVPAQECFRIALSSPIQSQRGDLRTQKCPIMTPFESEVILLGL